MGDLPGRASDLESLQHVWGGYSGVEIGEQTISAHGATLAHWIIEAQR